MNAWELIQTKMGDNYPSGHPLAKSVWWKSKSPLRANPNVVAKSIRRARGEKGYSVEFPMLLIEVPEDHKGAISPERIEACKMLLEACELRDKWINKNRNENWVLPKDPLAPVTEPKTEDFTFEFKDGVFIPKNKEGEPIAKLKDVHEFHHDFHRIGEITSSGPVKTFTYFRLRWLHSSFKMHAQLNSRREQEATEDDPRDFHTIVKVDTHIHLAAAMTARHLLSFLQRKAGVDKDRVVLIERDGTPRTLSEIWRKNNLDPSTFTIDSLNVTADASSAFQRFDIFNSKYNPFGISELRTIFLKSSNYINGDYYAELTQECMQGLEKSKSQCAEFRISIYGQSADEWDSLAKWVIDHKLYSDHQRWLIQVPRIWSVYKKFGSCQNFGEMLHNIFHVLFETTIDPSSHPEVAIFLNQVSGFDSVDDESRPEPDFNRTISSTLPGDWNTEKNPPYAYYMYYMWANITMLNELRVARGMKTFDFRPHCGESGHENHLSSAFLLADHINHGIQLSKSTPLQYLYYLKQIGCAVSPLSNNSLFVDYKHNPFKKLFMRGLNVSLSTDDPLQFHYTDDPLLEEYSIAAQKWNFSQTDISEIARNSVVQSGFETSLKAKWLGPNWNKPGVAGNDVAFSNISDIRVSYRERLFKLEAETLRDISRTTPKMELMGVPPLVRLSIDTPSGKVDMSGSTKEAFGSILKGLLLRDRYSHDKLSCNTKSTDVNFVFKLSQGVRRSHTAVYINNEEFVATNPLCKIPIFSQFLADLRELKVLSCNGPATMEAGRRLVQSEEVFKFHKIFNGSAERNLSQKLPVDIHHIFMVDNSLTHSFVSGKTLLKFIKKKITECGDELINPKNPRDKRTLRDLFESLQISFDNLTLDSLGVMAGMSSAGQGFAANYNPFGNSELFNLFLERDNGMDGKYFGELLSKHFKKCRGENKFHMYELHMNVHGSSRDELNAIAKWILTHNLNLPHVSWVLQISNKTFPALRHEKVVANFQEWLDNILVPLEEVTLDSRSHPELHQLLPSINRIEFTEEVTYSPEKDCHEHLGHLPAEWVKEKSPPDEYYLYYIWASLQSLNTVRKMKGLNLLSLRPRTSPGPDHTRICAAYLLCNSISGGLDLLDNPFLQLLYYLKQIGVVMSPLHDNYYYPHLRKDYPFNKFFLRGLKVTLATHTAMQLHVTRDALCEEYAIASQMYKFSTVDISEIARNSVILSGFPDDVKVKCLGENWCLEGQNGNDPNRTNIPACRIEMRESWLKFNDSLFSRVFESYPELAKNIAEFVHNYRFKSVEPQ
eukprot:TRINITY_DN2702_c0_g1_i1.p1 TRINITY_DN2702_c0_g1~~TRINITY_DN2702_c0_g1_i1.p1  ORF type:complete len:1285 (-),score=241.81 TRINITY_DN2702_c0_g1_i1:35-3889(-)